MSSRRAGLPPARDPRMDRGVGEAHDDWSVVLVPRGSGGKIREYSLTSGQVRWLRRGAWGLLALVSVMALVLGLALPRTVAYQGLVDENIALKSRLQSIDRRMGEVDRMLLRLRLYDAHLRALSEPTGDHGPLPEGAFANSRLLAAFEQAELDRGQEAALQEVVDGLSGLVEPGDLRPAEAWAMAVEARAQTYLQLFELAEPDLNQLVEELEDLRALESALPSLWPAQGRLTSGFGWRRSPFGTGMRFHAGIDIANRRGTPIYAPASGRVIKSEFNAGYGRMLEIDHGFGITTLYAHCHTLRVRAGDEVQRGDFVATVGSTGQSTGPHLHFEVRLDGHPVDPLDYLPR